MRLCTGYTQKGTALTGKSTGQGATSGPGRGRLLALNAQAVGSALGFGALAPGARPQHELTAETERAKHEALWVRARAVRPPTNQDIASVGGKQIKTSPRLKGWGGGLHRGPLPLRSQLTNEKSAASRSRTFSPLRWKYRWRRRLLAAAGARPSTKARSWGARGGGCTVGRCPFAANVVQKKSVASRSRTFRRGF
jgi:hypothetical protein